jgi:NAD(P)-dependent dehydrogenase (short-subunit alcohol dehydrogenase family)
VRLKGKVAVITGAGSGIGRASAILFAKEGAKVVLASLDKKRGDRVVRDIIREGGEAFFLRTDVSVSSDVKHLMDETVRRYDRLDVAFNNAGINPVGTVIETSDDLWNRCIDVNLKGVFYGMKYSIPHMLKQKRGSIINTGSCNAIAAARNEAAYDAAKGGVLMLTKATALDFGPRGIRVNCICPGATDTPLVRGIAAQQPDPEKWMAKNSKSNAALLRMLKPEEIAQGVLFLASDESSGVTGTAFSVDGGYTTI